MKIYLAGPDVFLPDAVESAAARRRSAPITGMAGLYPLDNSSRSHGRRRLAHHLQEQRGDDGRSADAIIANFTPFRGPSADAGTVYELGYMAGRGKLCLAYCERSHLLRQSRGAAQHEVAPAPRTDA